MRSCLRGLFTSFSVTVRCGGPGAWGRLAAMIDVTVPQLGESVTEGTISRWLVKEGDVVVKDQALVEIATDKADSELPAPAGGRVVKLLAKEGDVVPVRTVIC